MINWSEHFYYDETSPSCLRWNRNVIVGRGRVMYYKDDACLARDPNDYWITSIDEVQYKIHRIVWILNNGSIEDDLYIDHFDRNRSNNKISNLRVVTQSTNNRNSSKRSHNTTGVTGITKYVHSQTNTNYYKSKVTYNKKQFAKLFNIDKLGNNKAFSLAVNWRRDKLIELKLQGADFSENHGLDKDVYD